MMNTGYNRKLIKWLRPFRQVKENWHQLCSILNSYDQNESEMECFKNLNLFLSYFPMMLIQLNEFFEEGTKMSLDVIEAEKIYNICRTIQKEGKKNNDQVLEEFVLERDRDYAGFLIKAVDILNYIIKMTVNFQVEELASKIYSEPDEDILNRLNLFHLQKNTRRRRKPYNEVECVQNPPRKLTKKDLTDANYEAEENPNKKKKKPKEKEKKVQEQVFKFDKFIRETIKSRLVEEQYVVVLKIIHLFSVFVLSSSEVKKFLQQFDITDKELTCLIQYLQSIQRQSLASSANYVVCSTTSKPLNSGISPSYDLQPHTYASICSTKRPIHQTYLNNKYRAFPIQPYDTPTRPLTNPEKDKMNIEAEFSDLDEAILKLKFSLKYCDKFFSNYPHKKDVAMQNLQSLLNLRVLQKIYENLTNCFVEIETLLNSNPYQTMLLFRKNLSQQLKILQMIKRQHLKECQVKLRANEPPVSEVQQRIWEERDKRINHEIQQQLIERCQFIKNKDKSTPFEMYYSSQFSPHTFFNVFNSFEGYTSEFRNKNEAISVPIRYSFEEELPEDCYPFMILAFQDRFVCQILYTLIMSYITAKSTYERQQKKLLQFFHTWVSFLFSWDFQKKQIKVNVTQKQIDEALLRNSDYIDLTNDIQYKGWQKVNRNHEFSENMVNVYPITRDSNLVYSSQAFFYFLRIFYTIYERLLKMKDLENGQSKLKEFQLLWIWKLKKSNINGLNAITRNCFCFFHSDSSLKKYNYFLSSLPLLFDKLFKEFKAMVDCKVTSYGLKIAGEVPEKKYKVEMKRVLGSSAVEAQLLRCMLDKQTNVLYLNLVSVYDSDKNLKEEKKQGNQPVSRKRNKNEENARNQENTFQQK